MTKPASPTTWVYVDELSERGLLEALLARRTFVSRSPDGPCVELYLLHGGKVFRVGEEAPPAAAVVVARVEGGGGGAARLVSGRSVEHVWKIEGDPFSIKLEVNLQDAEFLWLETLDFSEDLPTTRRTTSLRQPLPSTSELSSASALASTLLPPPLRR